MCHSERSPRRFDLYRKRYRLLSLGELVVLAPMVVVALVASVVDFPTVAFPVVHWLVVAECPAVDSPVVDPDMVHNTEYNFETPFY